MIQCLASKGSTIPLILCDVCSKPITDASMAIVVFDEPQLEGNYDEFVFLHKGACDDEHKGGRIRTEGWMELKFFLADICSNAGLSGEKLAEAVESRDRLRAATNDE